MTSFSEANLKLYVEGMGMDTYTVLDNVYTSDDDPRAEDLKNCITIGMNAVPTTPHGNNIWENQETYRIDLYHAQFLSVHRIRELLQKYPAGLIFYDIFDGTLAKWTVVAGAPAPAIVSGQLKLAGPTTTSVYMTATIAAGATTFMWKSTFPGDQKTIFYLLDGSSNIVASIYAHGNTRPTKFCGNDDDEDVGDIVHVANQEYELKLVLDFTAHTYSFYVDGILDKAGIPFETNSSSVVTIAIDKENGGTPGAPAAGDSYFDNIMAVGSNGNVLSFLEKSIRPRQPVYYGRMKNGMHHWAMTFDITKTVEVT